MTRGNQRWNKVPIETLYLGLYDGPHATPKPASEGPVFLGIKNITEDGKLDLSEIRHIADEDFPTWVRRVLPLPLDIVFSYEATLHRYAIIPQGFRGCLGRRLALIRPNPKAVDPWFLFYYFFGREWHETISKHTLTGSTVDRIPLTNFPTFEISLPPLPIQRKIGAILSAYDNLIDNNLRRIKILEEMAQLIYREWFVNFRFPGHEKVKMVDSELGMIPGNWRLRRLGDIVDFVRGVEPGSKNYMNEPNEGTVPFIRVGDLGSRQSGLFIPEELAKGRLLDRHDIAVTLDGTVGIVQMGLAGAYSTGIRRIVVQDCSQLSWAYVYFLLKSEHIQGIIRAHARGTTIQHASSAIDHMTFVCPPKDLMQTFDSYASPFLRGVLNIMQRNASLRRTRDLLLPKLISGELDVSELDIDIGEEPV